MSARVWLTSRRSASATTRSPLHPVAAATDRALRIGIIAVGAALLSHLAADVLSAPDISTRIEPLWPLITGPIAYIDVLYYDSVWATYGLFALGLLVNAAFFYWRTQRGGAMGSATES